jgi:ubiquinone/menaquinone biosynthesis C-methylase UbiE
MPSLFDRARYRSQHLALLVQATAMQEAARLVARQPRAKLALATIRALQQRHAELHARDLANVDAGLYPRELLFGIPLAEYARTLPKLMRDAPAVIRRQRAGDYKDIPPVDKDRFPAYYRRTFHWQTDGYFSAHSAEVYDLGVEMLFRGTADVMRRQIIPPITRYVREHGPGGSLIDVGCGTGRVLGQIAATHPALRLTGVDLSQAYLDVARRRMADLPHLALIAGNGEALPCPDGSPGAGFDLATSVFLFHELPRNARRNVVRELLRVVKPGGLIVIEDSAQLSDSGAIMQALRNFPREFHEPFFDDYVEDPLEDLIAEVGGVVDDVAPHLVAKVVVAHRPR